MNENKALVLIEKLISRTKDQSIRWKKYSNSNIELKPVAHSPLVNSLISSMADSSSTYSLNKDNSYICSYNGGAFALLLYSSPLFGTEVQLRIQSPDSLNSQIYASTSSSSIETIQETSQLKRLYNLVDSTINSFGIDTFIDDFLQN